MDFIDSICLFKGTMEAVRKFFGAELHDLPIPTLSFSLPSFRPSDDLILAATAFSGIPAFIELIDVAAARDIADPLKARIDELIR